MSDPENKYDKNFYEAYALLKIGAAWPGYESGFEKFEQPDWINPERSIGLEVVQGITDTCVMGTRMCQGDGEFDTFDKRDSMIVYCLPVH